MSINPINSSFSKRRSSFETENEKNTKKTKDSAQYYPLFVQQIPSTNTATEKPKDVTDLTTTKKSKSLLDSYIEIEKCNAQLSQFEEMMTTLIRKLETQFEPQLEKVRKEIENKYEMTMTQKSQLVEQLPGNYLKNMSRASILPKGMRLFHCTTSEESIKSILQNGISLEHLKHNFLDPDMGEGLYCSSQGPTYFSDDLPVAVVFRIAQDYPCVITKSLENYRSENKLPAHTITEGYRHLQATSCALVNESLTGSKSEILILDPHHHIQVEGVILNPNVDPENVKDSDIIPLESWSAQKQIQLHLSWKVEASIK